MQQNIHSLISLVLLLINIKVIVRKFLSLLNLSKIKIFIYYKPIKILIVNKNKNFKFTTLKLVASSLESLSYS